MSMYETSWRDYNKVIFHIDVNSAFLSWEAVHRLRDLHEDIDIREQAAVIGGDQEKRHGIVLAKSTIAKKCGISTGEPIVSARKKCPNLIVIQPDFQVYDKASQKFMKLLREYAPSVEKYSIDEVWCDMTGTQKLYGEPVTAANALRERIHRELGFTVNIGISSNKVLAKMAGDFEKPNKVHTLFPYEIKAKMWPLPVNELFFVGRSTTKKLYNLGIKTIGQLANTDISVLTSNFKKQGEIIYNYANGTDFSPVVETRQPNKGYGNAITVAYDIIDIAAARQVILSLCETVCMRLRSGGVKASCLAVSIVDCEFHYATHQKQLLFNTNVTNEIFQAACEIFQEVWDGVTPLRQIGVHSSKVSEESFRQYSLFEEEKPEKVEKMAKMDAAIDSIRKKFGDDSVMRATFLESEISHMRKK